MYGPFQFHTFFLKEEIYSCLYFIKSLLGNIQLETLSYVNPHNKIEIVIINTIRSSHSQCRKQLLVIWIIGVKALQDGCIFPRLRNLLCVIINKGERVINVG